MCTAWTMYVLIRRYIHTCLSLFIYTDLLILTYIVSQCSSVSVSNMRYWPWGTGYLCNSTGVILHINTMLKRNHYIQFSSVSSNNNTWLISPLSVQVDSTGDPLQLVLAKQALQTNEDDVTTHIILDCWFWLCRHWIAGQKPMVAPCLW